MNYRIDYLKTLFNLSVFTCAIIAVSKGGILGNIAGFIAIVLGYALLKSKEQDDVKTN